MSLPHYKNSRSSNKKEEIIYPNLFEVTIFTPDGDDTGLILEHVTKVGGLKGLYPTIEEVNQKFKFTERSYAGMPGSTSVDISVTFTLNLNDANENYIFNAFAKWYKRIYNPETGEMGVKKDYTGSMIVVQHTRKGDIFRNITFKDIFPKGELDSLDELSYETTEPAELTVTFRCNHWVDNALGQ